MNESFSVGEIAILTGLIRDVQYQGDECEVIGPLQLWPTRSDGYVFGYRVRHRDGKRGPVRPWKLRKRRPPQDWVKLCNLTDLPREVTHV